METEKLLKPILSADEIPGKFWELNLPCVYSMKFYKNAICESSYPFMGAICKLVITLYDLTVCIHGTSMNNLDLILRSGLKRMGRNHVHFATGLPTEDGVISGMPIIIRLNLKYILRSNLIKP